MKKIVIAYVPVLHEGYRKFFEAHSDADIIFVWSEEIIRFFDHLARKDIRAIPPGLVVVAIRTWSLGPEIKSLDLDTLQQIASGNNIILMPDEDEAHELAKTYLSQSEIRFESVFLRWDHSKSTKKKSVVPDSEGTTDKVMQRFMTMAMLQSLKSSDWWRQVGAVLVNDGKVVGVAYNHHLPDSKIPYVLGDPRGLFHKGEHIELTTAIHAEAAVIAQAAKRGIPTEGGEIYVTTFPCPPCAKLIALSGITKLFFLEGYGILDAEEILKSYGVEIIRVEI